MRSLATATAAVALLFALVGCSTAAPETSITDAAAETTTAPPSQTAEPEEAAETEETTEPSPQPPESERGYLLKEIGEEAGLTGYDDENLVSFTVDAIERDPECSSAYSEKPANGHYLAITVTAQTFPELAEYESGSISFSEWNWEAYSAESVRLNDPVGNGYTCLSTGEMLPADIGPGQKVTGKIMLDVADLHGTVAFVAYGYIGWEWSY